MSRSRNIKPGFFKNEELAELSFEYRLLFQGLWCLADREGRLEFRPKRIKAEVFPYDNVDVVKGLELLAKHHFIVIYPAEDNQYIQVVAFSKHQHPHCKEVPSTIPAPFEHGASTGNSGASTSDSLNLIPDSLEPQPEAATRTRKTAKKQTLTAWVLSLPDAAEVIPAKDPIFKWAADVGLPADWISLAWFAFEGRYENKAKQYADWRGVFRTAVKEDWMHLWRADPQGRGWVLTTAGEMAQRERHA